MLSWDFEDPEGAGKVHHITVLCYHIQHPELYSREALKDAIASLADIVENGLTAQKLLAKNRIRFSPPNKPFMVKGTPENHGSYPVPVRFSTTACDITREGIAKYPASVSKWAHSIMRDLTSSGIYI